MKKTSKTKRKLVAYGLGIGGCGAMLAGSAEATLVDVTFSFGTVLDSTDGNSTSTTNKVTSVGGGADLGEINWKGFVQSGGSNDGKTTILLGGYGAGNGFYFSGRFASSGTPEYVSNTVASTWGDGTHLSGNGTANSQSLGLSSGGNAAFWSGNYSPSLTLVSDAIGVVGFKTFTQNWGYVEFDWDATAKTLTILSAKAETVANTSVTFSVAAIPEANPAPLMALFSLGVVGLHRARRRKVALAVA